MTRSILKVLRLTCHLERSHQSLQPQGRQSFPKLHHRACSRGMRRLRLRSKWNLGHDRLLHLGLQERPAVHAAVRIRAVGPHNPAAGGLHIQADHIHVAAGLGPGIHDVAAGLGLGIHDVAALVGRESGYGSGRSSGRIGPEEGRYTLAAGTHRGAAVGMRPSKESVFILLRVVHNAATCMRQRLWVCLPGPEAGMGYATDYAIRHTDHTQTGHNRDLVAGSSGYSPVLAARHRSHDLAGRGHRSNRYSTC